MQNFILPEAMARYGDRMTIKKRKGKRVENRRIAGTMVTLEYQFCVGRDRFIYVLWTEQV